MSTKDALHTKVGCQNYYCGGKTGRYPPVFLHLFGWGLELERFGLALSVLRHSDVHKLVFLTEASGRLEAVSQSPLGLHIYMRTAMLNGFQAISGRPAEVSRHSARSVPCALLLVAALLVLHPNPQKLE